MNGGRAMAFHKQDPARQQYMLDGPFKKLGYDWWWHSFTARHAVTGEEKPFFIEFYVCNPALGENEPVLGQDPENKRKGKKPSYLMVKAGTWGKNKKQIHRFFAWKDVEIFEGVPFCVEADDCMLTDHFLSGRVKVTEEEAEAHPEYMCDAGEMSWDLTIDKQIAFNVGYGASSFFRMIKAFEMYWHAEGMKSTYSGTVTLD